VKICDSSYLIAFLHPNPNPPMDRQQKPVTQFKERIAALIEDLSAANDVIGVPTPALAETLVRSGPNRAQYMRVLNDTWKFQLLPFDARAAIDAADLVAAIKSGKEPWETWAKIKFDIQIVAIAKAEGASVIYSDDQDIEKYARRFGIPVIRICDLPSPPPKDMPPIQPGPIGAQTTLFDLTPPLIQAADQPALEAKSDEANTGQIADKQTEPDDKLKADPAPPAPIRGSDEGRAEGQTAGEGPAKA